MSRQAQGERQILLLCVPLIVFVHFDTPTNDRVYFVYAKANSSQKKPLKNRTFGLGFGLLLVILCCFSVQAEEKFVLKNLFVGQLEANCYVFQNQRTQNILIIDPGAGADRIQETVKNMGGKVIAILLTHGHEDHLGGVNELLEKFPCSVFLHRDDKSMAQTCGVSSNADLRDGEMLEFDGFRLKVLGLPGHSPGSVAFLFESSEQEEEDRNPGKSESWLFSGDTVFAQAVGRTWFPGDEERMLEGIREKVLPLDDKTIVYPGHGPNAVLANVKPKLSWYISRKIGE